MKTAVLMISLLLGCSHHKSTPQLFTPEQVSSMAIEVLQHTPEHTHYAEGYTFDWVIFTPPKEDPFPEITTEIRNALRTKYIVYGKESDVPSDLIVNDPEDPIGKTYRGGFQFWVKIRRLSTDTIEVTYEDFENSMAAGHQIFRYKWASNRWKTISETKLTVS